MELLKALFESAELPTDFKEKTTTLFEAAVEEKVKAEVASLTEGFQAKLEEQKEAFITESVATIDKVVEETVLEWAKENAVALDSQVKGQIAESFLQGLKGIFEKADIELSGSDTAAKELQKLQEQNAELVKQAEAAQAALTEAKTQLTAIAKKDILAELTEGLADTQVHRITKLVEAFEFKSAEDFRAKAALVVEAVGGKIVAVNNGEQAVPAGDANVSNKVDASAGTENDDGELVKKPNGNSVKSAEGDKATPETRAIDPLKEEVTKLHETAAPHLHSDLVAETLKLFK